ncbi:MAG: 30S ribosomal protein S20 [Chlamydiae bacterium]|nr:30S ribosomal protein S20 [Chlamydiota bacterium]
MAEEKKDSKTKRPTAKKRDIQNAKRKLQNRSFKSRVKTVVRSFENEVKQKNETEAKTRLNSIFSLLDKGVKRGIYKLNKVGRLKSKYSKKA